MLKAHGFHVPSASALLSAGMLYYNSKSPEWLIFELICKLRSLQGQSAIQTIVLSQGLAVGIGVYPSDLQTSSPPEEHNLEWN